jgi:cation transport ATPase
MEYRFSEIFPAFAHTCFSGTMHDEFLQLCPRRKARRIIRQNLAISLGVITLLLPSAALGLAGIGIAIVFHEGSTLVVVANALRLLRFRPD